MHLEVRPAVPSSPDPRAFLLLRDGSVAGCAVLTTTGVHSDGWSDYKVRAVYRHPDDGGPSGIECMAPGNPRPSARDVVDDLWVRSRGARRSSGGWLDVLETFDAVSWSIRAAAQGDEVTWATQDAANLVSAVRGCGDEDVTVGTWRAPIAEARAAIDTFLDTLDPFALDLMRDEMRPPWVDPRRAAAVRRAALSDEAGLRSAWAGVDQTFVPSAPLQAALRAAPGFRMALFQAWHANAGSLEMAVRSRDVERLVDDRLRRKGVAPGTIPVVRDCARALAAAPEASWRWHAQWSRELRGDPSVDLSGKSLRLPPSWRPTTPDAWVALANLLPALSQVDEVCRGQPLRARPWPFDEDVAMASMPALLPCGGDLGVLSDRLVRASGRPVTELKAALLDVNDMTTAFAEQVLRPSLRREGVRDAETMMADMRIASDMFWRGRSVARMLEASRAWHARRDGVDAAVRAISGVPDDVSWPAAYPDATGLEGLDVVVLTTEAQLRDEGARGTGTDGSAGLAHCVGGYGPRCLSGELRIVSIRVSGVVPAMRTSTAALGRDRHGRTVVLQHSGRANAAPHAADVAALARYVDAVNVGTSALDVAGLAPLPVLSADRMPYDWAEPGACEAAIAAWRPVLPRSLRGMTPPGLAEHVRGKERVGHVGPWAPDAYVMR